MKEIKLTQGMVALVDDDDYESLSQMKWCAHKERNNVYAIGYYKESCGNYKKPKMHREIMNPLQYEEVDHKDGNGLNNQKNNLRICTRQQNIMNTKKRKNCSSRFKGVTWHTKNRKWRAYIVLNQKQINLGCYVSEIEAAKAYDRKAIELFGEFAKTNFK